MDELDWSGLETWSRGRLPHWELPGMTVFLTFRLWDLLPSSVLRAYAEERRILKHRLEAEGRTPELAHDAKLLFSERIEKALDAGIGSCVLRQPPYADLVMNALRHFAGDRYSLHAFSLMPNHVHVVTTLSAERSLSEVTHTWKSFTANQAQRRLGHSGSLWQDESYDHIVRDEGELAHYVRYTLDNPARAGLDDWPYVYRSVEMPGG